MTIAVPPSPSNSSMCQGLIAAMTGTLLDMASERPQSALNLRLLLTSFGLAFTAALIWLAIYFQNRALAVFAVILAVITIVDMVIIVIRRRRRQRREPGRRHSLFE
jgi:Family of unknown function (DUF6343)